MARGHRARTACWALMRALGTHRSGPRSNATRRRHPLNPAQGVRSWGSERKVTWPPGMAAGEQGRSPSSVRQGTAYGIPGQGF